LRVVVLADLHYEPRYVENGSAASFCREEGNQEKAPLGRQTCDSPLALIDLALQKIAELNEVAPFQCVIQLGDIPAHKLNDFGEAMRTIVEHIQQYLPGLPVKSVLGNNEGSPDYNFSFELDSPYLTTLYDDYRLGEIIGNESFKHGGYYSSLIADNLTLIVLNTVLYSKQCYKKYHSDEPIAEDPC